MKRILSLFLTIILCLSFAPGAFAASGAEPASLEALADAYRLHELGLFEGVGINTDGTTDFGLDLNLTRTDAARMLVLLLGKEEEAKKGIWDIHFSDVAAQDLPYVGFACANGFMKGLSSGSFGGEDPVKISQFLKFILSALGYAEVPTDASDRLWRLAREFESRKTDDITRGEAAILSCAALSVEVKGTGRSLGATLREQGGISPAGSTATAQGNKVTAEAKPFSFARYRSAFEYLKTVSCQSGTLSATADYYNYPLSSTAYPYPFGNSRGTSVDTVVTYSVITDCVSLTVTANQEGESDYLSIDLPRNPLLYDGFVRYEGTIQSIIGGKTSAGFVEITPESFGRNTRLAFDYYAPDSASSRKSAVASTGSWLLRLLVLESSHLLKKGGHTPEDIGFSLFDADAFSNSLSFLWEKE